MDEVGAIDVFNLWRHILVTGLPDQLDRLEAEIEQRFLALGWSRDTSLEAKINRDPHQANHFFCWVGGPARGPRVMLCLNRATPRRLRGGTYSLVDDPTRAGNIGVAEVVQWALNDVLKPAATAVGLTIGFPRFGPASRVGPQTDTAITVFAQKAGGQWPLPKLLETDWRRFVVTACRDDVAFDPGELEKWFVDNGWSPLASAELTTRFFADALQLSEYEDAEERPAWR